MWPKHRQFPDSESLNLSAGSPTERPGGGVAASQISHAGGTAERTSGGLDAQWSSRTSDSLSPTT
jgi:hypothetical protein